jgi:hypothetical protein
MAHEPLIDYQYQIRNPQISDIAFQRRQAAAKQILEAEKCERWQQYYNEAADIVEEGCAESASMPEIKRILTKQVSFLRRQAHAARLNAVQFRLRARDLNELAESTDTLPTESVAG